ncbi:hypothetical protein [Phaffia rhodozyma]|uniref:Uncharacterized protein n=1 Tax=Phaffia rhodozyma TaxID=264483 RepID=A0A0F7SJS0_PHARH|nr:hypothetical protein [Phaffia rhodozyma]
MRRQSHQANPSLSLRSTGPSTAGPFSESTTSTTASTKTQRRTSILDSFHATHIGNVSSLGVLGEQEDQLVDLTDRLATKERECEKESLLSGFQREIEKASREIEKGKSRERLLESHLERLFGPTWAASLDVPVHPAAVPIPGPGPIGSTSTSPVDSPTVRSALVQQAPSLSRLAGGGSSATHTPTHTSSSSSFLPTPSDSILPDTHTDGDANTNDGAQHVLAQLQSFRGMMRSLEQRIGQREGELQAVLLRAEDETRLWTSKQALYH